MRYTVDHLEESLAVLEDEAGSVLDLPLAFLPEGVGAGDVLLLEVEQQGTKSVLHFSFDTAEKEARLQRVRGILGRLRGRDPGGDLEL